MNPMFPVRDISRTTQLAMALRTIYQNMQNLDDNYNDHLQDDDESDQVMNVSPFLQVVTNKAKNRQIMQNFLSAIYHNRLKERIVL